MLMRSVSQFICNTCFITETRTYFRPQVVYRSCRVYKLYVPFGTTLQEVIRDHKNVLLTLDSDVSDDIANTTLAVN